MWRKQAKTEGKILVILPEQPFLILGTDLYEVKGRLYPVLVDYFSRYLQIARVPNIKQLVLLGV